MTSVLVYPGDKFGCGQYRAILPALELQRQGMDVQIAADGDDDWNMFATPLEDGTRHVHGYFDRIPDVDAIVIQRPGGDTTWQRLRWIKQQRPNLRIIVDMDDDFYNLPGKNPAHYAQTASGNRIGPQHLRKALAFADHLTVTTPMLANVYGPSTSTGCQVTVIRNYIPAAYLDISAVDRTRHLGWGGNLATHPNDLKQLGGAIAQLQREGHDMMVVGHDGAKPGGFEREMGLVRPLVELTGPVPFDRYPAAVARIGVGMVPLAPSTFNESKSWLKGLEYASVGVPFAATPTESYRALHEFGIGTLVAKPKHWARTLRGIRPDDGDRLREQVRRCGLTIEDQVQQWGDVWGGVTSSSGR